MTAIIKDKRDRVRKVLIYTLILNLFVMGLKGVVGISIGSLSLQADALHSVTDSANNILGLVTNRLSSPIPDREHPYGHLKFEALGALGIAAFLTMACIEILQNALQSILKGGVETQVDLPELSLLLIVLAINIFVAWYEKKVGKEIDSQILIADAQHTSSDVWITITVLIALVGVWVSQIFGWAWLKWIDVALALPVAVLVFKSGLEIVKDNLPWLVDEVAIPPETIQRLVMSVPHVVDCHEVTSRGILGKQVFIELHMVVDVEDLHTANHITKQVEQLLQENFPPAQVLTHVEPQDFH